MRKFKFRGWWPTIKTMQYFDSIAFLNFEDDVLLYTESPSEDPHGMDELEDQIIMQYTGSKDKNKEDLYEGDITIDEWDNITVICWNDEFGAYITVPLEVYLNETLPYLFNEDWLFSNNVPSAYLKIIGNIYENPELLQS